MVGLIIIGAIAWLLSAFWLAGDSHKQFDGAPALTVNHEAPSAAHNQIVATMKAAGKAQPRMDRKSMLEFMRKQMNSMGEGVTFEGEIRPVDAGGVPAEWILAPGADPSRRLLYVHGGAFTMGSPLSHRAITTEYARRLGIAVLAIDYRLMPEHSRQNAIVDCQNAYRWIIENGPDGPSRCDKLIVSGDSAGGNLTLMLTAWARDAGLPAATAAIALSPGTDSTMSSPSIKTNVASDVMLGPLFGAMARVPRAVLLWFSFLNAKFRPCDPLVSPLHGDLAGLPPTLVHVSTAEMLLDDGVRYVNKAKYAGSDASLEAWPFMLHVWHAFVKQLPEAQEAFDHIETFARRHLSS